MSERLPVAAYDIDSAGKARQAPDTKPRPEPGMAWRWLHFEVRGGEFPDWARGHLPPVVSSALLQTETRPRCQPVEDGLILILRGVNRNPGAVPDDMVSLRMWVTQRLVVSARIRRVFAADDLREGMASGNGPPSAGAFIVRLARNLTDRIEDLSLSAEAETDALEEQILGDDHRRADDLGPLRASAIRLRRHVGPQREALAKLAQVAPTVADPAECAELAELAERTMRTVEELDSISDRLTALQDHIASHTAERLTRQSFILSVVAAIFLPLGFLTGLFGVNVAGMPGTESPWAFALLSLGMLAVGVVVALVFRFMRWF